VVDLTQRAKFDTLRNITIISIYIEERNGFMEQQSTTPWGKIAVLALGAFVIGADGFMLAAVLPQVAQQLGVSLGQTGLLVTVFAWVYALAAPLCGMVMGRRNRRSTLVLALAIFAIGNGVAALASSFVWMMVARVMAALGSAMMMPTAMALATSLAPAKHRGKAISVVTTGMTMATVLAVPLGSVMGERYGYHTLFWAMAVAAVLVLCGIVLGIRAREAQPAQQVPTIRTLVAGLANRQVALTLLITVVIFVAGTSVISYLSAVVQQAGLHEYFSLILLIFGVGSLLGGVLGGWLTDRFAHIWLARWAMLAFALALALLGVAAGMLGALGLVGGSVLLWTASAWIATIAQQYRIIALAPERAQLNLSLNSSSIYIGQGFGGMLGSAIISSQPAQVIPLIAAGVVVLALAMTSRYETIQRK
jgi:putative major facilitator family transporter